MKKLKLDSQFIDRYKKFSSSDLFVNQPAHAKSNYWEFHSKKINFKIENSCLFLEGESGNYIPEIKYSFNSYLNKIKTFIKNTLFSSEYNIMSFKKAFNETTNFLIKESGNVGFQQVKIDKNKLIAKNISKCKKIFPFKYELNDDYIKSYYLLNILNSYMDFSKMDCVVEIGAGNGNLMSLIKHHFSTKCIIDVDLPETLLLSIPYLKSLFPKAKFLLPNEIDKKINSETLLNYDFIFLTPSQISLLSEKSADLFINIASFAEMKMEQIKKYFEFIQKCGKENSYFFNANRVEKIPADGSTPESKSLGEIKPTRFFEYPFFNNEILFFQISRFSSLVGISPTYIRLEKIIKN